MKNFGGQLNKTDNEPTFVSVFCLVANVISAEESANLTWYIRNRSDSDYRLWEMAESFLDNALTNLQQYKLRGCSISTASRQFPKSK